MEAFAFDPETGTVVIMFKFWATFEGCSEPPWDFHAIPLPALRRKAQDRDGGAP
jgi:hypothetical protein